MKAGYITKRFTPFHFEVMKKGSKTIVNVWPTARKILKKFSPGPAPYYGDIVEAVEFLFASSKEIKDRFFKEYGIRPNFQEELIRWWRQDPLNRMKEYLAQI